MPDPVSAWMGDHLWTGKHHGTEPGTQVYLA